MSTDDEPTTDPQPVPAAGLGYPVVASHDGLDEYGAPLPASVRAGNGSDGSAHKRHKAPPVPAWANAPVTLPTQPFSFTGMAALGVVRRNAPLRLPQGAGEVEVAVVTRALAQLALDAPGGGGPKAPLELAASPQMRLHQDAHACARLVTTLERDEVNALLRAEEKELSNAAESVNSPGDTLPPRSIALTVLCGDGALARGTLCPNARFLLDATAHLASEPSGSDYDGATGVRAASQVRFAFLHGKEAHKYATERSMWSKRRRNARADAHRGHELCVTWPEAQVENDEGVVYQLRSEFADLPYCDSADAYVTAIQTTTLALWRDCSMVPGALRLLDSYAQCAHGSTDAFARHALACAHDFWEVFERHEPARLSEYARSDSRYAGALEWADMCCKMVPKNSTIDGPNVGHAFLLHQRGWSEQAHEFGKRVKSEEAERNVQGAFGLRAPLDTAEVAVGIHLLVVCAEQLRVGRDFACFGLRCVPGEDLGTPAPTSLVWRLLPLDTAVTDAVYVLPCHGEHVFDAQIVTHDPLCKTNDRAMRFYANVLKNVDDDDDDEVAATAGTLPSRCLGTERDLTHDERVLSTLVGLPLSNNAFRIGEVLNALQSKSTAPLGLEAEVVRDTVAPSGLHDLLVAAAAALTPEASLRDAFEWAALSDKREAALKKQLAAAEARAQAPEPEPPPPPPPPQPEPPPPVAPQDDFLCPSDTTLLFRVLNQPIVGVSIKAVIAVITEVVSDVDSAACYEACKPNVCKKRYGDLDRIARIAHHALRSVGFARRAFVVATDAVATKRVHELRIAASEPFQDLVPIDGHLRRSDAAGAVVLHWVAKERALAASVVT